MWDKISPSIQNYLEYDCLRKKVVAVSLGAFKKSFIQDISSKLNKISGAIRSDGSVVAERVSGFLNASLAGLRAQADIAKRVGTRAILFEDLDKSSPTYGALAIGTEGVQIADKRTSDDRDWAWSSALTGKGLIANIIISGLLSDKTGKNYWNLDSGDFVTRKGEIGGWSVSNTKICGGDPSIGEPTAVMQRPYGDNYHVFAAGGSNHHDYSDCPFRVTKYGKVYATDVTIDGKILDRSGGSYVGMENGMIVGGSYSGDTYTRSVSMYMDNTNYFWIKAKNNFYLDCGSNSSMFFSVGDTTKLWIDKDEVYAKKMRADRLQANDGFSGSVAIPVSIANNGIVQEWYSLRFDSGILVA